MFDAELLIAGGTLVTEHELIRADLAVRDGRVAAVLDPDRNVSAAGNVLDARGLYVLPGVVDCHVHFNEPGRTNWEGYATGTAAAAAGGITTVLDMPLNSRPPTLDAEALSLKRQEVASHSLVDYAHWGGLVPGNLDALEGLRAGGVVGYKAFMCDSGLEEFPPVDAATLHKGMRRIADLGGVVGLHAESEDITSTEIARRKAAGRHDPRAWAEARPPSSEEAAVKEALVAARETGARVHFVHISTAEAVERISEARRGGVEVTVETCPHYLTLNQDDLDRLGPIAKCAPPLRFQGAVEALWRRLLAGDIDCVSSDHSPCAPEEKQRGNGDIWQAWGGISGIQTLLPSLVTEGVHRRGLRLTQAVRLTSGNPARLFGLYPRKGALLVGSDADLTLLDLDREWTLREEDLLTRWPISPFVGRRFRGAVVATIVRGTPVYRDGRVVAQPGHGQLLSAS